MPRAAREGASIDHLKTVGVEEGKTRAEQIGASRVGECCSTSFNLMPTRAHPRFMLIGTHAQYSVAPHHRSSDRVISDRRLSPCLIRSDTAQLPKA